MPPPARANKEYLEMHGAKWRVVVAVPKKARGIIGKSKLKQDLGTDSLAMANYFKPSIIAAFKDQINRALNPEGNLAMAMRLAKLRQVAVDAGQDVEGYDIKITQEAEEIAGDPIATDHEGQPVFDPVKDAKAHQFHDIAMGKRTPLDASRETYLKQLIVKSRTLADDNRAFGYLMDWCKQEGVPAFRESFLKKEAVRFSDDFERSDGRSPVTLNKYIIRLGLYWKWMEKRGEVDFNVWDGRSYTVPPETEDKQEREFTSDEMVKLLSGPTSQHMHDLMRIAALTGARLEVMVSLTVKDCQNGSIWFKPAKREKAGRSVPVHPELVAIIRRRTEGKQPHEDLFPEWPPVMKKDTLRERSFKASNHFTAYRRSVGVTDKLEDKRRDRVNFHSFRRWFMQEARFADIRLEVIQAVVGQRPASIAFSRYAPKAAEEQKRRCVEAVKLPEVPEVIVVEKQRRRRRS